MSSGILLLLLFAALLSAEFGQPWLSAAFVLGAVFVVFFKLVKKSASVTKKTGKILAAGVAKEMEESEGSHPSLETAEVAVKNAGELAGQQAFSGDKKTFRYKGIGAVGGAFENVIKFFGKIFK